jgi:hypothetical protein
MNRVLRYTKEKKSQTTIRKNYIKWRESQGIPLRCDAPECAFFTETLMWNGKAVKPILDHINGNNSDNREENLRFLCPNCDSQLESTRGGANKGRIEKSEGGFAIVSKPDGKRAYFLPAETGYFKISGQAVAGVDVPGKHKTVK